MTTAYIFNSHLFYDYTKKDEPSMLYFHRQKNITKGNFIMGSITQILNSINNFSSLNFIFSKYIETFRLLNDIPETIPNSLNDIDFIHHIKEVYHRYL